MEEKTKVRLVVAGGRDFTDWDLAKEEIQKFIDHLPKGTDVEFVCGMARGADLIGKRFADNQGYPVKEFPANWLKYGKAAGHHRNAEMAQYGNVLIAFWDGESRGTASMIDLAKNPKYQFMHVHIVAYESKTE